MTAQHVTSRERSARNIRTARLALGLSVQDLAQRARVAPRTLVRIEAGYDTTLDTLDAVSEALGTTTPHLLRQPDPVAVSA